MNRFRLAVALGAAFLLSAAAAQAQAQRPQAPAGTPPGAGAGPGYGCPGWGPGHGMGPGMMGGYGMGPGMMGGYGMGPGMMGGGAGMMGGPGMMGGYGNLAGLNLTDDQRKSVNRILDEQQKAHYDAMGKMMEQNSTLRNLYSQEKWDANAIAAAYEEINKQRTAMIRTRVDARNRIYDLLTPEQRKQFRQSWDVPPG